MEKEKFHRDYRTVRKGGEIIKHTKTIKKAYPSVSINILVWFAVFFFCFCLTMFVLFDVFEGGKGYVTLFKNTIRYFARL